MEVDAVQKQIESAVRDEQRSGRLRRALREHAKLQGRVPGEDDLDGAVGFVVDYVRHVPAFMRDGLETATIAGLEREMHAVLEEAGSYWSLAEDIIPDRLGLLGVLDDAYCSLTLIQSVSDRFEEKTGRRLFAPDLRAANEAVRRLVGEPLASRLDMYVGSRLDADPMLQMVRALTSVSGKGGGLSLSPAVGIWGDAAVEQIVRARLGDVGLA
ncbi:MAG: hypothetical protein R6X22_10450 [Gemmatimonadota bacterium]